MSCDSRNLIYVVKCPTCKEELIGEKGTGESRPRDGIRIHKQDICQPQYKKLKIKNTSGPTVKVIFQYSSFKS